MLLAAMLETYVLIKSLKLKMFLLIYHIDISQHGTLHGVSSPFLANSSLWEVLQGIL